MIRKCLKCSIVLTDPITRDVCEECIKVLPKTSQDKKTVECWILTSNTSIRADIPIG